MFVSDLSGDCGHLFVRACFSLPVSGLWLVHRIAYCFLNLFSNKVPLAVYFLKFSQNSPEIVFF